MIDGAIRIQRATTLAEESLSLRGHRPWQVREEVMEGEVFIYPIKMCDAKLLRTCLSDSDFSDGMIAVDQIAAIEKSLADRTKVYLSSGATLLTDWTYGRWFQLFLGRIEGFFPVDDDEAAE